MAIDHHDSIHRMLDHVRTALTAFSAGEFPARPDAAGDVRRQEPPSGDLETLLAHLDAHWDTVCAPVLGATDRAGLAELNQCRADCAQHRPFGLSATLRALDTAERLLNELPDRAEATAVAALRRELLESEYALVAATAAQHCTPTPGKVRRTGLQPWRELIPPHPDIVSGRFLQTGFRVDLDAVHRGENDDGYGDPVAFFNGTHITQSLQQLLWRALLQVTGALDEPLVELQSHDGGGKTHALTALYHLFGPATAALPGIESLRSALGGAAAPPVRRVVLVGPTLLPGRIPPQPDGTVTATAWGALAWQLGGSEGYQVLAARDREGASPEAAQLGALLERGGPCVILLDDWVPLLRRLYRAADPSGGPFAAHVHFLQALVGAVRATPCRLLVASLPATTGAVGGDGGWQALLALKQALTGAPPGSRPVGFSDFGAVIRRRLFQPLAGAGDRLARAAVANAFSRLYRDNPLDFPAGCVSTRYHRLLENSYPLHPLLLESLAGDWRRLERFPALTGALRLLAAVVHALWHGGDRSLMILPGTVPLGLPPVQAAFTRYLPDTWDEVIATDVDGTASLPARIESELPDLGRAGAARRVARSLYLGSVVPADGRSPGLDERWLKLAVVQPEESPLLFNVALQHLAAKGTYLHLDGSRYWFTTQPSLARLAADRAGRLDEAAVQAALVERLRRACHPVPGEFTAVLIAPADAGAVPDTTELRLVALGPAQPHSQDDADSPALQAARTLWQAPGSTRRRYGNTLVFLAADPWRLESTIVNTRLLLGWQSLLDEPGSLELGPAQLGEVRARKHDFENSVIGRVRQVWNWLLFPAQENADSPVIWRAWSLPGSGDPVMRAAALLVQEQALVAQLAPSRLALLLNRYLWGRAQHIDTQSVWERFAGCLYLPRLANRQVLVEAIAAGSRQPERDGFAYAESFDAENYRYGGLSIAAGSHPPVVIDGTALLVKAAVARAQIQDDAEPWTRPAFKVPAAEPPAVAAVPAMEQPAMVVQPTHFHGSVQINPEWLDWYTERVDREILQRFATQADSRITLTLALRVELPGGAGPELQQAVIEHCRMLQFDTSEFEQDGCLPSISP